jgi:hypothetical protein
MWAEVATDFAGEGTTYRGKSSPHWYDVGQFLELLYAAGNRPVRDLIMNLDGCARTKTASDIVAAAGVERLNCREVGSAAAAKLLTAARTVAREVKPDRLGAVGDIFSDMAYAKVSDAVHLGGANIPFVAECWASQKEGKDTDTDLLMCVNRTPVAGTTDVQRKKRAINVFGCGLHHTLAQAPAEVQFDILVNLITPYMPITSDGKAPDFEPFVADLMTVIQRAVRKARRPGASATTTQKDIVLDNLDNARADVSGGGQYRFNPRQILYVVRKFVSDILGKFLTTKNFDNIITDYENEHGEISGMYHEPRGSLYHPHRHETITLGTLMVEDYERPVWTFSRLVYIEKEGFAEALKDSGWPERHDCALLSSKGFSTRAARDLIDKLAVHDEPIDIFAVHDADGYGTIIYQTLQEATRARGARKIRIINLGLEPWEGFEMGLEPEAVEESERYKPVADYVREREDTAPDGSDWEEWLQTNRIELNAMTPPPPLRHGRAIRTPARS